MMLKIEIPWRFVLRGINNFAHLYLSERPQEAWVDMLFTGLPWALFECHMSRLRDIIFLRISIRQVVLYL
jgi:hypothetical protein